MNDSTEFLTKIAACLLTVIAIILATLLVSATLAEPTNADSSPEITIEFPEQPATQQQLDEIPNQTEGEPTGYVNSEEESIQTPTRPTSTPLQSQQSPTSPTEIQNSRPDHTHPQATIRNRQCLLRARRSTRRLHGRLRHQGSKARRACKASIHTRRPASRLTHHHSINQTQNFH